ncbi:MAG: hypothetical protein ABJA67_11085, partial [Chthonomonadales bacterium]
MGLRSSISALYGKIPLIRDIRVMRDEMFRLDKVLSNIAVLTRDAQLQNCPRYNDPKRLLKYGFQVSSQNAEDGMIREIFRRIGTTNLFFAEVGIGDGTENNTAFLLSQGWTGAWIDGDDAHMRMLLHRKDLQGGCLKAMSSFVTQENVVGLFEQLGVPKELDLLSLDVDMNTYYLWLGLKDYRPRVAVLEYNPSIPPDVDWKVNYDPKRIWDGSQNYGASLKAYELLGRKYGYSLVGCDLIGANAFFVRDDLVGDLFAAPFTA